ncbi:MAG: peptidylprolyl isomerase [Heteroscytonema crispum UTEX LB 1556]
MNDFSKIFIEPEEIVNFLKSELNFQEVCQKILFQRLIYDNAQERGITVTTEEIEAEADRQRREKRLEKAADTLAWLANMLVSPHDWETGIRNRLLSQKLAENLFAKEVEKFFLENRLQFEQVLLYQIIVSYEKLAQELYYQIEEGEISFYDAAHLYDIDENRRKKCGYEGKVYRWAIQPDLAAIVFSSPPQQLIGPLKTQQGYHLFIVDELLTAELTRERYQEILNNMFQHWLTAELDYMLNSLLTSQFQI